MWWSRAKQDGAGSQQGGGDGGFSARSLAALTAAGWEAGRRNDTTRLERDLVEGGFVLHEAGHAFLTEFGGLAIDVPVDGNPDIRGFIHLDPRWVLRLLCRDEVSSFLPNLIRGPVCPIGTASGHSMYILMDEGGITYLLDRDWGVFARLASSAVETIETLCDGRNGRVDATMLVDGKLTKAVIRSGDEQRLWGLEEFPDLKEFFPAASLEPARRPPTAHAMPRALQTLITKHGILREKFSSLLATNGGFMQGCEKRMYYAAHTENVLAIRRKAPFKLSALPPNVPSRAYRAGECAEITQPPTRQA